MIKLSYSTAYDGQVLKHLLFMFIEVHFNCYSEVSLIQ